MNVPLVQVVLASHNGGQFLREQIDSILCQTGVELSLLVFDDASSDNTVSIVNTYIENGHSVRLFKWAIPSGGAFQAYAALLSDLEVCTRFVAFCDQDDVWLPGKLDRQIQAIEKSGADGCSASVIAFKTDLKTSERVIDNAGRQTPWDFYFEGGGQGCSYVFKTERLADLKRALEYAKNQGWVLPHDWLLYALCRLRGAPWLILEEPQLRYRQHSSNAFGARGNFKGFAARVKMLLEGSFRQRRLQMARTLESVDPSGKVPLAILQSSPTFFTRCIFALPRILSLRRFKSHSIILGVAFIVGFA